MQLNTKTSTIIWDFNGTLLDDMQVCIDCMNLMLAERALPALDLQRYREIFTFPVKEYYEKLGFDFTKEPFEIPAHQFIDYYRQHLPGAPLHKGVKEKLEAFKRKGIRQVILSAMEQELLEETLASKGILHFFHSVAGIRDHLGNGKLEMARELVHDLGIQPDRLCLIGDTVHDYEVAAGAGIPCILVAQGHQSYNRLRSLPCPVVRSLAEVKTLIIVR